MVMTAAPPMSGAEFRALLDEVSNWGRWGADDQRGTLNALAPEHTRAAAQLVRSGESVSLALPLAKQFAADTDYPLSHHMIRLGEAEPVEPCWLMDWIGLAYHGSIHSHLDALCHCLFEGQMYNGTPLSSATSEGAAKLSIEAAGQGIVTRGVLLDIPRLRGLDWLEPSTPILAEDLDVAERACGVRLGPGDVLLVRTGRHRRRARLGPWSLMVDGAAGLHASTARWLHARTLAALGGDGTNDVIPSGVEGCGEPMHVVTLVAQGLHLLDNLWLEDLAEACTRYNRWEFLIFLAPLRLPGGTGSPLNPIAVF